MAGGFLAPSFSVINTQFILNEPFARRHDDASTDIPSLWTNDDNHDDTLQICREYYSVSLLIPDN